MDGAGARYLNVKLIKCKLSNMEIRFRGRKVNLSAIMKSDVRLWDLFDKNGRNY